MMNKQYFFLLALSTGLYAQNPLSMSPQKIEGSNMINIGIPEKNREQISQKLNTLLAHEFTLYTKTLKYHWNVVGPLFGPLHTLFGDQYAQLLKVIDAAAERIRALGFMPQGTLQEFSAQATIKEDPGVNLDATTMIRNLMTDHETIIKQIRGDIDFSVEMKDMGTNNFLSDLIEKHEKMAWMLRAHLEQK